MGFRVGNSLVGFDEVGFIFSSKTAYCKFQAHVTYGTLGSGTVTCNQFKLPGPSAVGRKLLILDAGDAVIYSLPQQMAQSVVGLAGMGRWTHVAMFKSGTLETDLPACTCFRGISFYINMQSTE